MRNFDVASCSTKPNSVWSILMLRRPLTSMKISENTIFRYKRRIEYCIIKSAYHHDFNQLANYYTKNKYGFNLNKELKATYISDVPIDRINYTDSFPFPDRGEKAIVGEGKGHWDIYKKPLADHRTIKTIRERFIHGLPWDQTTAYLRAAENISKGRSEWQCNSFEELEQRCKYLDNLWSSMADEGYKSQTEIWKSRGCYEQKQEYMVPLRNLLVPDELRVAIGREGELIRTTGGKHRLSMAKLLGLDCKIPVIIQLYHTKASNDILEDASLLTTNHPLVEHISPSH